MASLTESRIDHRGDPLPDGVYALIERNGEVVSYKARWRERDANGVQRQRSKSFSRRSRSPGARRMSSACWTSSTCATASSRHLRLRGGLRS